MNGLNLQIYHLHQFIYNKILILNLLSYPIMMFWFEFYWFLRWLETL